MLVLDRDSLPGIVVLRASGILTKADYDRTKPEIARIARTSGPVRLLAELHAFIGWTPRALLTDIRFDLTHQDDFRRIAIVGERRWQDWLTRIAAPFFKAEMRFFDAAERDAAIAWLRG